MMTCALRLVLLGQPIPEAFRSLVGPNWDGRLVLTEGRPLLTGARCTAPALLQKGYHPTLISDNMVAYCMWKGMVDAAVICYWTAEATGLVCPTGALGIAMCAAYHHIPTYALPALDDAPVTTADDLFSFLGQRVAAEQVEALVPPTDLVEWKWLPRHSR